MTWVEHVALLLPFFIGTHGAVYFLGKVRGHAETHERLMAAWEADSARIFAAWKASIWGKTGERIQ